MFMAVFFLLGTGYCFPTKGSNIVKFSNDTDRFYNLTTIDDITKSLVEKYNNRLTNCYNKSSDLICYKNSNPRYPISILLLGGFYTHPVTPVLLLRCAEFFAIDDFEELNEFIEIHILPIVNKGGFKHMLEEKNKTGSYKEVKTNYVKHGNCTEGINIDRNFEENFKKGNKCDEFYSSNKSYTASEANDIIELIKIRNYKFILNFQGWEENDSIIPYAHEKKKLNKTDLKIYKKLLGNSFETYHHKYGEANGTFIDTAFKYGKHPVYISLKGYDNYTELKDLDDQCRTIKEYLMEGIKPKPQDIVKPPLGKVQEISELKDRKTVKFSYKFKNLKFLNCVPYSEMKFYFNKKDQYRFSKCEIVYNDKIKKVKDKVENKIEGTYNNSCLPDYFLSSEKLGDTMYNTIRLEHNEYKGCLNYTINIYFSKKEESIGNTMRFFINFTTKTQGDKFNSISSDDFYDIKPYVEKIDELPILISVFCAFLIIIFIIISV